MSRWPSSSLPTNNKHCCSPKSGKAGSSQQNSVTYLEGDNDCPLFTTECSYLNSNDLGPKHGGVGLASIFLTFSSSYKHDQADQRREFPKGRKQSGSHKIAAEVEANDELSEESKYLLCAYIFSNVIGCDFIYKGPFGSNCVTYLDYVASGRPLKCIEQYIRQYVMPTYSNTHTEVNYIAQQTSKLREEEIIRECVNASEDDTVIFTGNGATAAVNKLIHAMNIRPFIKDLSPVVTIRQTEQGLIDLENLALQLEIHTKCSCSTRHLLIGSFSAASNVTGILTDVNSVASLMHVYGGYAFFDYACAAPYIDIDMNPPDPNSYKDAIFISPHKFIGGPQTPGILVAKRWVFRNPVPHGVGGGTVIFVRRTAHVYTGNVEYREEGGTPAIIESIRAGLVFKLKAALTPKFIMAREQELFNAAKMAWFRLPNLLILGNLNVDRLPIFPLLFMNPDTGRLLHHDFVANILNDVFGIQVRSGCACAGPYGMDLLGMKEAVGEVFEKLITVKPKHSETGASSCLRARNIIFKPGFVRLNFPYFISEDCFNFVLKAIQMTSEKGWILLPLYNYDRDSGRWWYRLETNFHLKRSLRDVTFRTGQFDIKRSVQTGSHKCHSITPNTEREDVSTPQSSQTDMSESCSYDDILSRAELIFAEAENLNLHDMCDNTMDFTGEEEALRWFMLPSEAANIINNIQVRHVVPEDLPFLPEALRNRLHTSRRT